MTIDKSLLTAYLNAEYVVFAQPEFIMHVDEYSEALHDLLQVKSYCQAAFITADNPFSHALCESQNSVRQAALKQDLQSLGLPFIDGVGTDKHGDWPAEKSFLVFDVDKRTAIKLAVKYEQNAILWIDETAVPQLTVIDKN